MLSGDSENWSGLCVRCRLTQTIAVGVEDLLVLFLVRDLGVDIPRGYATTRPSLFDPLSVDSFARFGGVRLGPAPAPVRRPEVAWPPATHQLRLEPGRWRLPAAARDASADSD